MPPSPGTRQMWFTKRAVGLHLTVLVVVPAFLGLFWWQVQRVRAGNTLSWAYVFEWPFFTGYAVYLWWRLVHEQPGLEPAGKRPAGESRRIGVRPASAATAPLETTGTTPPEDVGAGPGAGASAGPAGTARAGAARAGTARAGTARAEEPPPEPSTAEDEELAAYNRYLAELHATGRRKRW